MPPEFAELEIQEKLRIFDDEDTRKWVRERSEKVMRTFSYYRCAMMEVETKLNVLNEEYSIMHERNPINSIKSRLKTFNSIQNKLDRKGLPKTVEAIEKYINDVAGIRVICTYLDDVYMIAQALLNQDDISLIEKKDYISYPKKNGYRSLHLIVEVPIYLANEKKYIKVEVQLRTIAMDCWATFEHQLKYKSNTEFTDDMQKKLLACADISAALDMHMQDLRMSVDDINRNKV